MITMIIPTYTLTKDLEEMALRAIATYHDQVDELIVTEDGGFFSPSIISKVDRYIYNRENRGYVRNVNDAWQTARGDYVIIANSDTYLDRGYLADLCVEGRITSPETRGQEVDLLAGHFFCVPTLPFGKGILNESLHTFCSDADLEKRFGGLMKQVPSVKIWHDINQTLKAAYPEGFEDRLEKDRKAFHDISNHTNN